MRYDIVIVGAGAAGLMCAMEAGRRGRRVLLLDHARAAGEKIRISGGGRCNFTNLHSSPKNFLSQNPRFCISALRRYTPQDFIALVKKHGIAFHEKKLGQLFCDGSSTQIIDMLLKECREVQVQLRLQTAVKQIFREEQGFRLTAGESELQCESLVIATGGPSIPKIGATVWGYDIAKQFGMKIVEPRAALVPFTLDETMLKNTRPLSGIALDATATCNGGMFEEAMLFTHRGLSGPAMLQISSYWRDGDAICINALPGKDLFMLLKEKKQSNPKKEIQTALAELFPDRFADYLCASHGFSGRLADLPHKTLEQVAEAVHRWHIIPSGTEGYRTAEVTLGGVDTAGLSSQTMESTTVKGLYFIGEVVDVTGHLGGHNFQWAWSSGWVAGQGV